jgi:N-acetylglucosamine-6-phosphate deacetylase
VDLSKGYIADRIFTGSSWLDNHAVIVTDGRITDLIPVTSLSSSQITEQFHGSFLTPSFIDLQIYGASGKLFAVFPDTDALSSLYKFCAGSGTAFCLPTVATNEMNVFYRCIDAIRAYWKSGGKGILGLHIEGPWINVQKRGAHIEELVHPPSAKEVKELLIYGDGVIRMITLAPEVCDRAIIDLIKSYGIIVSAGHSSASYAEAMESFSNGVSAVTHLFNAMSPLHHREPGLTGAAMDDDKVMASIIPDGYHVDPAAVRIARKVMKERLFIITDAVTETSEGYYPHQLAGEKYEAGGILSGSALTMSRAVKNLTQWGVELDEALRMASLYPARLIRRSDDTGMIAPGFNANLTVMDNDLSSAYVIG